MYKALFWKEIQEHLKTFRFGAALITTFILVLISVWILGENYILRLDSFNKLSEEYIQGQNRIVVPSCAVPVVSLPPSPLGVFAEGEQRRFGNFVSIRRWEVPREADISLTNNEFLESATSFDLLAVFTVVISLFGILFSYDSICGERERGTLKLLCGGRLRRGAIFGIKFLGIITVLALPFLISLICGLLVLQLLLNIVFSASQWLAIALMAIAGLIFGAVFVAVGMFFSSLQKRSSTTLITSLLIWAVLIFLIPIAGARIAESIVPVDSSIEIMEFEDRTDTELSERVIEFSRNNWQPGFETTVWGSANFEKGGPDNHMYDGSPTAFRFYSNMVLFAEPLWLKRADDIWNLVSEKNAVKSRQAELVSAFSAPSPAFQLSAIFTALAGTGYSRYSDFMESARRYRRTFIDSLRNKGYFGEKVHLFFSRWDDLSDVMSLEKYQARKEVYRKKWAQSKDWFDMSTTRNWDDLGDLPEDLIPPFEFRGSDPDFASALSPVGILAAMMLVVFAAGFVAFLRYDIR